MLAVSLDCPCLYPRQYYLTCICPVSFVPYVASFSGLSFFTTPSVFSNIYFSCVVYPMLAVSLDCPFLLPFRYSLTCICPVSCAPYVASFSGLSIFDCTFGILQHLFVLCLVYPMLPVSLDCPFLIAPSVFSNMYLPCVLCTQC